MRLFLVSLVLLFGTLWLEDGLPTFGSSSSSSSSSWGAEAAQLRRVWMQDLCHDSICSGVEIGPNDFVILSQSPVPKQIMLTFVNSTIAKIPHLMFDTYPDLQILRMENCSVELFEKPQFEGASYLMSLFLGHNLLREIPKNIFLGADNLNTLSLKYNRIRALNNNSFHGLKELKELSLAGNQLESLPLGVFYPLRKLMDLDLAENRLELFHRGIFDKNLNLTRINLARNRFKVFESELFKLQTRISLLDLSGNVLQELTLNFPTLETIVANDCDLRKLTIFGLVRELELRNNSLREIPHIPLAANVTSLDLSHNPLGSLLQGNPFRRFTALERLNLSATNMHEFPEGLLKKQTHLKLLDISANSLYSLKITIFDSLKDLQYFYFQQNNWNCDFLQLLMNSIVKKREFSFNEDIVEPQFVDDYIDGIACWYESNNNHPSGKGTSRCAEGSEAALELSIVRNEIKTFTEIVEKKFIKVYRMLEEMKMKL